jgi:hypothetical protein
MVEVKNFFADMGRAAAWNHTGSRSYQSRLLQIELSAGDANRTESQLSTRAPPLYLLVDKRSA